MKVVDKVKTLGELRESGWQSVSVKEELRRNLIHRMKKGEDIFPGVFGYEKTVIPQLQNAVLSHHDVLLLGLRGQAKSKILRLLVGLLDEYMPVVAGSEINDDPFHPLSRYARNLVDEKGDEAPIEWVHRLARYGEKLATPDTTVADLIGDIDPIKAATRRLTLADEEVIHFGLIPRTNRGIFVINELPDLQPRIQVALLNIMQERDIQIRGFNIRIPLDVAIFFSANPEDYTNRGNIITPLKDRIDSQIITHYPRSIDVGMQITSQEAWTRRNGHGTNEGVAVEIPRFIREIVEETAVFARDSEYVDQKSGVSARMTITAIENIISNAERRAYLNDEKHVVARITDLYNALPALTGKLELVYEGEQEGAVNVARLLIGKAVGNVFKRYFPDPQVKDKDGRNEFTPVTEWFARGNKVDIRDTMSFPDFTKALEQVNGLKKLVDKQVPGKTDKTVRYSMMEFVLEALHQYSMLGKNDLDDVRTYTDMVGSMLGSIDGFDDDLEDYR